jgi:GNAT superfamily N-acetyltransferase
VETTVVRDVDFSDGRHLRVRAASTSDIPALVRRYERLPVEDRRARFFNAFQADAAFFADLLERARGGAALVAEVSGRGAPPSVVGDAVCLPLPNGDGELAMVLDREWRGWIGPYLLDALIETARSAGIPNIEADVLATNAPMLAVLRARGAAVLDSDDFVVRRLIVGTAPPAPTWPRDTDRARVLVEGAGGRWRGAAALRALGVDVITCPGPDHRGMTACPGLADERCPLVAGADAVVVALPDSPSARALIHAALRCAPQTTFVDRSHFGDAALPSDAHPLSGAPTEISEEVASALRSTLCSAVGVADPGGAPG